MDSVMGELADIDFPDRRFQLWEYRVSHGGLLIRSPRGPNEAANVDLVFDGVEFISCPRLMRGLRLDSADANDMRRVRDATGREIGPRDEVFVLVSQGSRHLVVASSLRTDWHSRDIFDSPFSGTG
ncbi:hypothetical protein GCM10017772_06500 [Promicromonospora soli]|uniref:Uncharacterized protein n=1 Tax=Promicromonospora soli TaxID=2035533 RepID=A0A919FJM3_9MICO|nr:hypothetical protein GCM10017772_06500 [Promicromonospora soli]